MDDLFLRVQKIIVETLIVDIEQVTPTARFIQDLGADSLDLFDLVLNLQHEFGLKVPDGAVSDIKTVQEVVVLIEKLIN